MDVVYLGRAPLVLYRPYIRATAFFPCRIALGTYPAHAG